MRQLGIYSLSFALLLHLFPLPVIGSELVDGHYRLFMEEGLKQLGQLDYNDLQSTAIRANQGYAICTGHHNPSRECSAYVAIVHVNRDKMEYLRDYCDSKAREYILEQWLDGILAILDEQIDAGFNSLVNGDDNAESNHGKGQAVQDIKGFINEYLEQANVIYDLGCLCKGLSDILKIKQVQQVKESSAPQATYAFVFTSCSFEKKGSRFRKALKRDAAAIAAVIQKNICTEYQLRQLENHLAKCERDRQQSENAHGQSGVRKLSSPELKELLTAVFNYKEEE